MIRQDTCTQTNAGPGGKTTRHMLDKGGERAKKMVYQDTAVQRISVLSRSQWQVLTRVRLVRQRAHVTAVVRVWPLDRCEEHVGQSLER